MDSSHYKEKDHDRDENKYSIKYFDGKSLNGGVRSSKREGMFTDKRLVPVYISRMTNWCAY